MADVNINKFRASVVRDGSKPSSPGFIVSEGQDPVNPPGTNNYVPYSGATANVELGEYGVEAGFITLDTTPTNTPTDQGTMYWDDTKSTAALVMNGTIQHIGQDTYFYVKNSSGSSIAKGTSVRFAGTDGASGHLLIAPFLANGTYPSSYFMGVTAEAIANGSFGQVMHFGELSGVNTSGYTAGALLYASTSVAGAFQTTAPVAPNNIVLVAAAINSTNNGTILVRPTYGSNINQDEGVKITSGTTGDLLQLQAGGLWENKTLAQVIGSAYVPSTRTITINGTTQDLSANRTYNVGTVTAVTASSPLFSSGGTTPNITIQQASGSQSGFLSSTDWTTFNNKQNALTNPVTGTGVSGRVAFWNGTTTQASDNQFFWDNTNKRLGVGTNTPSVNFEVSGDSGLSSGSGNPIALRIRDNSTGSSWNVLDDFGQIQFFSNDASTPGAVNIRYTLGTTMEFAAGQSTCLTFRSSASGILTERWRMTSAGILQSNGAQTIQTSTGNLTLATAAGNGNIVLSPNGTGITQITGNVRITSGQEGLRLGANSDGTTLTDNTNKRGRISVPQYGTSSSIPVGVISGVSNVSSNAVQIGGIQGGYALAANSIEFFIGSTYNATTQSQIARFFSTGNLLLQSGGTFTDAGYKLDVNGTGRFSDTISTTNTTINMVMSFSASEGVVGTLSNHGLQIRTNSSTKIFVTSGGNVGIGTASPNAKLEVNGNIYTTNNTNFILFGTNASVNPYIQGGSDNSISIGTGNLSRLFITSGGNVGIGTTSPGNFNGLSFASPILDVAGSIQIKGIAANGVAALQFGGETYRKGIIYTSIGAETPYLAFGIASSGSSSSASEVMRITSNGFLKASNTGNYASSTGTFHELITSITNNNIVYLYNSAASPYGPYVRFSGAAPNNGTNYYLYFDDTSTVRFRVNSNGGISNYQANDVNLSDERTKKDIEPLESYWDKFKNIEIVKFKYKDQTHDDFNIGVIAQQVEKIAPEFVDVDGWSNETESNKTITEDEPMKSIYTADLHHATIKVLQEAMAKIEAMQREIDNLKN